MSRARASLLRLVATFHRGRADQDFADELASHLAMHVEDNLRAGMNPLEARRQAILKLGGVAQVEERVHDRRGLPWLENLLRDLRFGVRMLRRSPGFTAVAVLTLGLGIGANTAIFSVVNAVLLRPLPYPRSGDLVLIWATNPYTDFLEDATSYPSFEDWQARSRSFEYMAAFTTHGMTLTGRDQAETVEAVQATPGLFELLGVPPALGRTFQPGEEEAGAAKVALLSDSAWKRYFGGRKDVLGRTVRADEETYTIVGVMPPAFRFNFSSGPPEQIYVPVVRDPDRGHSFLRVVARLRPGSSLSSADAEMKAIAGALAKQYPATNRGVGAYVVPLVDALVGDTRVGLAILLGVVTLVLLIACTNVANLMLARSAARQRELALRAALGAGRARLLQQLVIESTALALAGGALGLLLSSWTSRLLVKLLAQNFRIPRIETTSTDVRVFLFALLLSLATGLLFGAFFAPLAVARHPEESLRESGRTLTGGLRSRRLRGLLVVTETALALVLLAAAGLLLKNLWVLRATPPGFATENLLSVGFSLPESRYGESTARRSFHETLLARTEALPGVRSAALVTSLPLANGWDSMAFHIPGRPDPAPDGGFNANFNLVSPGYFRTLEIPLREGRGLGKQDAANAPGAVVVNEAAARRFWPGKDAIGKTLSMPSLEGGSADLTVVGVAADVRQMGLARPPEPEVYLDCLQPGPPSSSFYLVVRTAGEPAALGGSVRQLLASIDRDVPVRRVRPVDEVLSASMARPRVYTLLLGLFASLALTLAAVGLYGVVSYTVAQRTSEMGVRLALGAERAAVLRLVLREGLGLTLAGTILGLATSLAVSRLLTRLIPGTEPGDPLTLALVSALLLAVALFASYLPARRASHVDPTVALRYG